MAIVKSLKSLKNLSEPRRPGAKTLIFDSCVLCLCMECTELLREFIECTESSICGRMHSLH